MAYSLYQVDAFTSRPFAGNPAAVCLLPRGEADPHWMQEVAREMNLSETAFLTPRDEDWDLRWFTPTVEVDLCGHATLASAHVLFANGLADRAQVLRFHTLSGILEARCLGNWLELDFPAEPALPAESEPDLLRALGARAVFFGLNRIDYLVQVADEEELLALKPDMAALASFGRRGVIVTAAASRPGYDFVSRFFGPGVGIDEDPVTGSAHCCLGPYWGEKLKKSQFRAWQASARGGELKVRLEGERVFLGGQAVSVFTGKLL